MAQLPPIRRQIVVPAAADVAFEVFTVDIGLWWPVAELSVYGDGARVAFDGGRLVEKAVDGEAVWGEVLDWEPPNRLRMTWHPGSGASRASEVEVSFAEVTDDQTLVTIEHRGWEHLADPTAARAEYEHGWPQVLDGYAGAASKGAVAAEGPVWLALMHTPGPAVPDGGKLMAHPDFPEHFVFLRRLAEAGVLVAAGPLDGAGDGMTVIRLPDARTVADWVRAAQADDRAVARGVLMVRVRPWSVALTG
jgi:uncharacterized protein YndB with AHSA1/START domain/uncharacterized protein YciI